MKLPTSLVIITPNSHNDTGLTSIVQVACLLVSQGNILNRYLSPVHVGVREAPHEWIGADHLLDADARAELAVAARELVDLDLHHVGVVVEFDEALESLPLEDVVAQVGLNLLQLPLDGSLDGVLVALGLPRAGGD